MTSPPAGAVIDNRRMHEEPTMRLHKGGPSPEAAFAIGMARQVHAASVSCAIGADTVEVSLFAKGRKLASGVFINEAASK